ncbi:MAG TPA: hypothetical protein VKM55_24295 [Candidatus Lokiarchaeia archaeon]|nr:hypothetical protein [Candidatus Lokiarchaeia archaeon]
MPKSTSTATLLKLRDIARAYEAGEGKVRALASRFHASTNTVSEAIHRPSTEWQADIDAANHGALRQWEYAAAVLDPIQAGGTRLEAYALRIEGQSITRRVEGTSIVAAANVLGRDGWEIVHIVEGEHPHFFCKRPVVKQARGGILP